MGHLLKTLRSSFHWLFAMRKSLNVKARGLLPEKNSGPLKSLLLVVGCEMVGFGRVGVFNIALVVAHLAGISIGIEQCIQVVIFNWIN